MSTNNRPYVCPAELSGSLDNPFRKWIHKPEKILKPFIKVGMTVLDLGCGPGYFSIPIAGMVTSSGKVISADLQEKMLEKVVTKIKGTDLEPIFVIHKCGETSLGYTVKVDFILAFWMIHEVPDKVKLFNELKSILKPEGKILIVEPKIHVTKRAFNDMLKIIDNAGFKVTDRPKVSISRAVLLAL